MKGQLVGPFSFGGMKLTVEGMLCVWYLLLHFLELEVSFFSQYLQELGIFLY